MPILVSDISNGFHTNGNYGNASKIYYGIINTKVNPLNQPDLNKYTPQKVKFSIRICPVNVTISAGICGFGHIY